MADINQIITWGIGTPASISYYVLNGLASGEPAPPSVVGGGGATPVRNWDGRGYERGNVEVIRRGSRRVLRPGPVVMTLSITATPVTYKPQTINPSLPHTESAKPLKHTRILQGNIRALILSIKTDGPDHIHASVTQIQRLKTQHGDRLDKLEERTGLLEAELREALRANRQLQASLSSANDYIDELEERVLLGA